MVVMDEVHMMISEEAVLVTAVASEWAEVVGSEWPEVAASEWAEVLAPAEWEVIYFCLILNILLFSRKKNKNKFFYKNNYIFRCWPKRSNKPCGSYARFAFPCDRK